MKRRLSSKSTWFWKVVFPSAWITLFGAGTLWSAIQIGLKPMTAVLVVVWLAVSVWLCQFAIRLREVSIDETYLYVTNLRKEIQIPMDAMQRVKESFFSNPKLVTISLKGPTGPGSEVAFVPERRLWDFLKSHPVVTELREIITARSKQ